MTVQERLLCVPLSREQLRLYARELERCDAYPSSPHSQAIRADRWERLTAAGITSPDQLRQAIR